MIIIKLIKKNENGNAIEEEKVLSTEEIAIKSIKNYIFISLCLKILLTSNSFNEDLEFNKKSKELKDIK